MKVLYAVMTMLFGLAAIAGADGYLTKEPGVKGNAVQIIAPKITTGSVYSSVTGMVSARPVKDVTNVKVLGFQAAAADKTSIPVTTYLCTGTTVATCDADGMDYPLGGGTIAIGPDVKGVAFGVVSSASLRTITVQGR